MPFTRTDSPPSTSAKVTVGFAGLMLLKPGAANTCDIGVHRWTTTHTFHAMLIVCRPNRPPRLIRLLTGPLTASLAIRLDPDPGTGVFKAFARTPDPFIRNAAGNHDLDYRWAINLRERHPNATVNDGARPEITLKTGVLYTPTLTRVGLNPELVKGNERIPLYRFAADLAAAIEPPAGSKVRIEWSELGELQYLSLPRAGDPAETIYIISLMNDPPISSPESHDELDLYYRVLATGGGTIPDPDRWKLQYVQFEERDEIEKIDEFEKTDEIPCMPVTLEP